MGFATQLLRPRPWATNVTTMVSSCQSRHDHICRDLQQTLLLRQVFSASTVVAPGCCGTTQWSSLRLMVKQTWWMRNSSDRDHGWPQSGMEDSYTKNWQFRNQPIMTRIPMLEYMINMRLTKYTYLDYLLEQLPFLRKRKQICMWLGSGSAGQVEMPRFYGQWPIL